MSIATKLSYIQSAIEDIRTSLGKANRDNGDIADFADEIDTIAQRGAFYFTNKDYLGGSTFFTKNAASFTYTLSKPGKFGYFVVPAYYVNSASNGCGYNGTYNGGTVGYYTAANGTATVPYNSSYIKNTIGDGAYKYSTFSPYISGNTETSLSMSASANGKSWTVSKTPGYRSPAYNVIPVIFVIQSLDGEYVMDIINLGVYYAS